jgi:hypothetical protein
MKTNMALILLLLSANSFAVNKTFTDLKSKNKKNIISWGHNLSPTTSTLSKGEVTAGIYVVGVGITDDVMVGVSPWFNHYYNMNNAVVKAKLYSDDSKSFGIQTAYFKSQNKADLYDDDKYYQMEASISNLIMTNRINSIYSISSNISYHYYFDETVPFSIRRESFKDEPYQLNISTFHEVSLEDNYSVGLELGALGLNYLYPQLITGVSFNYKGKRWQMQLGLSFTGTTAGYLSNQSLDNNKAMNGYTSQDKEKGKLDFSAHPEIQLQHYF